MNKSLIIILAVVLLAAVALSGCGSNKAATSTSAGQTVNNAITSTSADQTINNTTTSTNSETPIENATLPGVSGSNEVNTYTDSSQTINVKQNQEFIIALQSNPTTGYDWQPVFDSGLISQVKKDYQQTNQTGKPLVGSGGTDYFTFKGLKSGDTKITFTYYRPWEKPTPEDQQQVFDIVIK